LPPLMHQLLNDFFCHLLLPLLFHLRTEMEWKVCVVNHSSLSRRQLSQFQMNPKVKQFEEDAFHLLVMNNWMTMAYCIILSRDIQIRTETKARSSGRSIVQRDRHEQLLWLSQHQPALELRHPCARTHFSLCLPRKEICVDFCHKTILWLSLFMSMSEAWDCFR
jgi:hypothetical protein